jgi:hypothetical protein
LRPVPAAHAFRRRCHTLGRCPQGEARFGLRFVRKAKHPRLDARLHDFAGGLHPCGEGRQQISLVAPMLRQRGQSQVRLRDDSERPLRPNDHLHEVWSRGRRRNVWRGEDSFWVSKSHRLDERRYGAVLR